MSGVLWSSVGRHLWNLLPHTGGSSSGSNSYTAATSMKDISQRAAGNSAAAAVGAAATAHERAQHSQRSQQSQSAAPHISHRRDR